MKTSRGPAITNIQIERAMTTGTPIEAITEHGEILRLNVASYDHRMIRCQSYTYDGQTYSGGSFDRRSLRLTPAGG
jgi:hypothetical protein